MNQTLENIFGKRRSRVGRFQFQTPQAVKGRNVPFCLLDVENRNIGLRMDGHGHGAVPLEGQPPGEHLIEHHAGGVDVAAGVGAVAVEAHLIPCGGQLRHQMFAVDGILRTAESYDVYLFHLFESFLINIQRQVFLFLA